MKQVTEVKNWYMNYEEHKALACTAPCSLYSVLYDDHKIIEDPFWGTNHFAARDLCEKDCEFYATVVITEEQLNSDYLSIKFHGLDTLCDVYMNGKFLGHTENMHRAYEYDIKTIAKVGENEVFVKIASPIKYITGKNARHHLYNPFDAIPGTGHLRKAIYVCGSDWGPQLPDMGIYGKVEIIAYQKSRLENALILQKHENGKVFLSFDVEATDYEGVQCKIKVDGKELLCENKDGKQLAADTVIENPRLWWPNGFGEHPLYEVVFELYADGVLLDTMTKKIGLRTLTVSTAKDAYGNEFCFVINGKKIFAMGANIIPEEIILPRRKNTKRLIETCVKSNYNTVRVWGGGYYPSDSFYDLCDENGIIVWQDFMFSCLNILLSEKFKENAKIEAIENVKRLRHHASLGLFCGNNEMELALLTWGVSDSELAKLDYLMFYEHLLDDVCSEYAPEIFYWPSSPCSGGGFEDTLNPNKGDCHYWEVWHQNKPFSDFRKVKFRYMSEFGFQSFPNLKTIKTFAEDKDLSPFSEVMDSHQKCVGGNGKILFYGADHYPYPKNFEAFVYVSQLLQADAIKCGVEHFRRNRGFCMGTTYWQMNDCWPVASWASLDYYGRWKALQYAAKKFYAPVLLSLCDEGTSVVFNVQNETFDRFSGKLVYSVKDNEFHTLYSKTVDVFAEPLSANDLIKEDFADKIGEEKRERFLEAVLFDRDGNEVSKQTLLFIEPKHYRFGKPSVTFEVSKKGSLAEITFRSDVFTKALAVDFDAFDAVLSDNYFDITSGEGKTVTFECEKSVGEIKQSLRLFSVYDIG